LSPTVRDYEPGDERSWLRCRVLGFLDTAYYDDVLPSKPPATGPDMVAVTSDGTVVGIVTMTGTTIDTVVVHPDHRRQGVGRALIDAVVPVLPSSGASTIEAWTRDDPGTLSWYKAMGFTDDSHYLHVYADRYAGPDEPSNAGLTARPGLKPMVGFLHGTLADEQWARAHFRRVHVCRRFARPL
jgi:GNAT superfamily N-acetyltransferase